MTVGSCELDMISSKQAPVVPSVLGIFVSEWLFFLILKTGNSDTTKSDHPKDASWIWFELQTFDRWDRRGASFSKRWQTAQHKDKRTKGFTFDGTDLPVPCSYSRISPLSGRLHRVHRLSSLPSGWCKSELCMAGTQSRGWAPGRTASSFSKRRCGPSSPTSNPTLLLLLSRQANNQTSLLAEQDFHRNTTIRTKTPREKTREICTLS